MQFETDIFSVFESEQKNFDFFDAKLPNNKDVFFMAKKRELFEQYQAARSFMEETDTDDWNHWFEPVESETANEYFKLFLRSTFFEAALFYYNAIVDVSWTLCYVAVEFACNRNGTRISLEGIAPIEEAVELLRSAEKNVTSPTADTNPFEYLKKMCPEFTQAIDLIVEFWIKFASSEIRKRYNFCKHKGKPEYEEIVKLNPQRFLGYYKENRNSGERIELASNIQDVRYMISLESAIMELKDFDDKTLFPYINELINIIDGKLNPSPFLR